MAHLKWSDIQENNLFYTRKKTSEDYNIGLNEGARTILEYFRQNGFTAEIGYVFPILDSKRHLTPTQIENRIDKVLKQTNEALKQIGELVRSPIPLTTYVARHTFATVLRKSGVTTAHIQEMLGHTTEKMTQTYLDSFDNEILNAIASSHL